MVTSGKENPKQHCRHYMNPGRSKALRCNNKPIQTNMKILLILLLLIGASLPASSQNTGYLGKHVILKTDLINGKRMGFQNADLELITARNFSLNASFRRFSYAGTSGSLETKSEDYDILPRLVYHLNQSIPTPYYKYTTVYPGKTEGWLAAFGAKYYFNKILPAPLGLYTGFDIGFGSAELNYDYQSVHKVAHAEQFSDNSDKNLVRKSITSTCNLIYFSLPSLGYQTVLVKRLVLDGKIALETYTNNLPEDFLTEYPYPYFSANLGSGKIGKTTTGISVYGKIGFLLF